MIKNILFDFGGVFVRLNREEAVRRFQALGVHDADELLDPYQQQGLFLKLEEGQYGKAEFTVTLNRTYGLDLSEGEVGHALMGFLEEVQQYKFRYIREELPKELRLLGISNINPFIWEYARSGEMIDGGYSVDDFFEKVYPSYEYGLCKPDKSFFDLIVKESDIRPEETLFIDDGPGNTAVARELGFVTYCPENGEDWRPILDKMLK
ncbi:HAD family phosphatase [uncultured Porphyromonas sp.]|uniref:HAD family hydrolase n=1 Tax=uncultured Porphyromonas sp. TaxID=159274 RepID=UPI00262B8B80|nr:HAD family phosphatase [uncultured Porphyromonas sp.]